MMPEETMNEKGVLQGWKQIAQYFDKDIRTIQDWEKKYNLPIRRDSPGQKPRVYALVQELKLWRKSNKVGELNGAKQKKQEEKTTQSEQSSPPMPKRKGFKTYFLIGLHSVILTAAGLIIGLNVLTRTGENKNHPMDFNIEDSHLIILDGKGRELWRYDTGLDNLWPASRYRKRFQFKWYEKSNGLPLIIIQDLNADGANEVLFSTAAKNDQGGGTLIFFNSNGEEKWSFYGGRELKFGETPSSGDTRIFGILVCNLDNKGTPEIILIGYLNPYFPCYLDILDINGNILGEFWNSGHILDIIFCDFHGDNRKEIVVAGVNNEYREAFLAVFDSSNVWGASPQQVDRYTCRELGPSTAKYYIRFPRTDLDLQKAHLEYCWEVRLLKNGHFQARMQKSDLYYELNSKFEVVRVGASNQFQFMHRTAVSEGKITSTFNEEYIENIKKGVLYHNGTEWVSKPSMATPWTD
jgi:hypothetical protein